MNRFSVITLVRNRETQLRNLLESIALSERLPVDIIIVRMERKRTSIQEELSQLVIREVVLDGDHLPLARARNLGAHHATGDVLIFVDVDCICSPSLFTQLLRKLKEASVLSAPVKYLSNVPSHGNYVKLSEQAIPHPNREVIKTNEPVNHTLFWSLIFAIHNSNYWLLNGFDEKFSGYGGEDTDFAERFHQSGMKLIFIGDYVLHQYHPKYDPPLNHIVDICTNANYFKKKHGYFPMFTWLTKFCELGFAKYSAECDRYELVKTPTEDDLATALSLLPY